MGKKAKVYPMMAPGRYMVKSIFSPWLSDRGVLKARKIRGKRWEGTKNAKRGRAYIKN